MTSKAKPAAATSTATKPYVDDADLFSTDDNDNGLFGGVMVSQKIKQVSVVSSSGGRQISILVMILNDQVVGAWTSAKNTSSGKNGRTHIMPIGWACEAFNRISPHSLINNQTTWNCPVTLKVRNTKTDKDERSAINPVPFAVGDQAEVKWFVGGDKSINYPDGQPPKMGELAMLTFYNGMTKNPRKWTDKDMNEHETVDLLFDTPAFQSRFAPSLADTPASIQNALYSSLMLAHTQQQVMPLRIIPGFEFPNGETFEEIGYSDVLESQLKAISSNQNYTAGFDKQSAETLSRVLLLPTIATPPFMYRRASDQQQNCLRVAKVELTPGFVFAPTLADGSPKLNETGKPILPAVKLQYNWIVDQLIYNAVEKRYDSYIQQITATVYGEQLQQAFQCRDYLTALNVLPTLFARGQLSAAASIYITKASMKNPVNADSANTGIDFVHSAGVKSSWTIKKGDAVDQLGFYVDLPVTLTELVPIVSAEFVDALWKQLNKHDDLHYKDDMVGAQGPYDKDGVKISRGDVAVETPQVLNLYECNRVIPDLFATHQFYLLHNLDQDSCGLDLSDEKNLLSVFAKVYKPRPVLNGVKKNVVPPVYDAFYTAGVAASEHPETGEPIAAIAEQGPKRFAWVIYAVSKALLVERGLFAEPEEEGGQLQRVVPLGTSIYQKVIFPQEYRHQITLGMPALLPANQKKPAAAAPAAKAPAKAPASVPKPTEDAVDVPPPPTTEKKRAAPAPKLSQGKRVAVDPEPEEEQQPQYDMELDQADSGAASNIQLQKAMPDEDQDQPKAEEAEAEDDDDDSTTTKALRQDRRASAPAKRGRARR